MRSFSVSFRPQALEDLEAIFMAVLSGTGSVAIAVGFVERLRLRCERIGHAPHSGRPRDDLEPGLRTVPFEKTAVIAYRVEENRVRVLAIFYGGRDYEALYRNGE